MLCDKCKKNEATVHLTQSVDDEVSNTNLCEECAQAAGIDIKKTISVTDILLGLEKNKQNKQAEPAPELDRVCAVCGISCHEYKKRGHLGCAACYQAFSEELDPLIRAMQHHRQHHGKMPVHHPRDENVSEISCLQQALQEAIENEQFEEAARLRDLIKRYSGDDGQNGEQR